MEPNVVYQCKRHLFELVEEFSDMVWWTLFLCCLFIPLSVLFDYSRLALIVILSVFPIGRFIYEIIAWQYEVYQIIEAPKDTLLVKKWGIVKRQQISESVKNIAVQTKRLLPFLDWEEVYIKSSSHVFIEGRRVPTRLANEILKARTGLGTPQYGPTGSPTENLFAFLPHLVRAGLVDAMLAKSYTEGTLLQMMGAE